MMHSLAEDFCVCTRWFSTHPGSTWVNHLYMLAGRRYDILDNPDGLVYHVPSAMRVLDGIGVSWRGCNHDFPFLAGVDPEYRTSPNFDPISKFYEDARSGTIPKLSWIDLNFVDVANPSDRVHHDAFGAIGSYPETANDDHPPTDIAHGQALIMAVADAVIRGRNWRNTLLIVTYDEHGGFYDHVPPPLVDPASIDSDELFQAGEVGAARLGVRVPTLVVSPRVGRRMVVDQQFDHTSILKTVLTRWGGASPP
jgi:phospholipase C